MEVTETGSGLPICSFAPDGIERFEDAAKRSLVVEGLPVCHIDDIIRIIRSKEEAGRVKDRESLPPLRAFRDWWIRQAGNGPVDKPS